MCNTFCVDPEPLPKSKQMFAFKEFEALTWPKKVIAPEAEAGRAASFER